MLTLGEGSKFHPPAPSIDKMHEESTNIRALVWTLDFECCKWLRLLKRCDMKLAKRENLAFTCAGKFHGFSSV